MFSAGRGDVIRSMPLFEVFRRALTALGASVGGPSGLSTLLSMHCRAGVAEAASQLLDGTLEDVLTARRTAAADAARNALLSGWTGAAVLDDRDDDVGGDDMG